VLEALADRIAVARLPHPVRIGVDGVDAAGKTTLADELAPLVEATGRPVVRATVDDFHRPRAERRRRGELSADGFYLDTFDYDSLRRVLLEPLGAGGDRSYRSETFDLAADRPSDAP